MVYHHYPGKHWIRSRSAPSKATPKIVASFPPNWRHLARTSCWCLAADRKARPVQKLMETDISRMNPVSGDTVVVMAAPGKVERGAGGYSPCCAANSTRAAAFGKVTGVTGTRRPTGWRANITPLRPGTVEEEALANADDLRFKRLSEGPLGALS